MKASPLFAAILALGLSLAFHDAEAARRFGGGKSLGMQREAVVPQRAAPSAPQAPRQATAPNAAPQSAPAPAAQPRRSWMGPLAGLAAGLGLAALASHFGFGEELASLLTLGLLVVGAVLLIGFLMRKKAAPQPALAGAGYGTDANRFSSADAPATTPANLTPGAAGSAPLPAEPLGHVPEGFDREAFLHHAKVNFIRLQAANDAGDLDDIRAFTTPEMFAEIKMNLAERGAEPQKTDVVSLEAEILDVREEGSRYLASVRFHGLIRENPTAAAEAFDEVWHLVKPVAGQGGWVVAGIQQMQ